MKKWCIILAMVAGVARAAAPEFFVFDNGVGRGSWTPERQAKTLKDLGFDGISYNYTKPADLAVWQKAFRDQGLKIFGLYVYTFPDKPDHAYDHSLRDAIKLLKGSDHGGLDHPARGEGPDQNLDEASVKVVQEIADLAAPEGVRVALYGHKGFYVETGADAARIVKLANRPNLGASINLCHEFLSGKGDALDETVRNVASISTLVSINGVDVAGKKYIQRLDQGDFDVAGYLKKLLAAGYKGPVGLQCFSVTGDIDENLKADIEAWRTIAAKLSSP